MSYNLFATQKRCSVKIRPQSFYLGYSVENYITLFIISNRNSLVRFHKSIGKFIFSQLQVLWGIQGLHSLYNRFCSFMLYVLFCVRFIVFVFLNVFCCLVFKIIIYREKSSMWKGNKRTMLESISVGRLMKKLKVFEIRRWHMTRYLSWKKKKVKYIWRWNN